MPFQILFSLLFVVGVSTEKARYDHYQLFRLVPTSDNHIESLRALKKHYPELDFWMDIGGVNNSVDIMLPPNRRPMFHDFTRSSSLSVTLLIENIQRLLDQNETSSAVGNETFGWTDYFQLENIYNWMDTLASKHKHVRVEVMGKSYEGREIRALIINNGEGFPGAILETGIHARERIGPASTAWIINQILDSDQDSIWRKFNYLYVPVSNPDGYQYTFTKDRLWRKTRTPYRVHGSFTCYGADPNRNFGYHWAEDGARSNPCDEIYSGPRPFSELETKAMSDFFANVSSGFDIYLSFHSYGQKLIFPWGFTTQRAPMHDTWKRIGEMAAEALKSVYGTVFQVGSISEVLYIACGSSADWYFGKFNASLVYAFELRDQGQYGFELPKNEIIPVGRETMAALQVLLQEYKKMQVAEAL